MLYSPAFWAMFIANLTTVASFGAFFLFPLFVTEHGGSEGDIGLVMGAFALASALCRPWISEMIDRFGRKRCYTLGCLILAVMPLSYLAFDGDLARFYLPLLAARVVHGIGLALCFTAVFTYIVDIIPPQRLNEGIGIFGISGLVGLALGPVIAEGVLQRFGFNAFFVTTAGLATIGLLVHLPLRDTFSPAPSGQSPSFFALLGRKKLLEVASLSFLFGFGLAASGNFVAPMAEAKGLVFVSLYYLCYSTTAILVRVVGGRMADRLGERRILPPALLITAGGLFLLPTVESLWTLALAGLLAGGGHGLLFPTLNSLAVRGEPSEVRGKVTGIFTGGIDSGSFMGALALGYIGEWGGFGALFTVAGGALAAGLLLCRKPGPTGAQGDSP